MKMNIKIFYLCLFVLFSFTSALSSSRTYEIPMVPLSNTDSGTGIYSLAFNSPYQAIRHIVPQHELLSRFEFDTTPQMPVGSVVNSWSYSLSTPITDFPEWLSFVSGWAGSSGFALVFNATGPMTKGLEPDPFVFELRGTVYYTHGPNRYVEQELRVVRLIVHLNFRSTISDRSSVLGQYFSEGGKVNGNITPFNIKSVAQRVPSFRMEANEMYVFNCKGNVGDFTNACVIGDTGQNAKPIWVAEGAHIKINSGVLRVTSSMASWGSITISENAALVFDAESDLQTLAFFSDEAVPLIINDGVLAVNRGVVRLTGTTMLGKGSVMVARGAGFEVDTRYETIFGDTYSGEGRKIVIYNEGTVKFVSGKVVLSGALITVGLGIVHVGMAAEVWLTGKTVHVLGGVETGSERLTNSPGVNELGSVVSGRLALNNASLLVGSSMRVQGLGHLYAQKSHIQINIEFFGSQYPDAGIISSGPPSERPMSSVVMEGGELELVLGGLKLGSGIEVGEGGKVKVGVDGFVHLTNANARNEFSGSSVRNDGDWLLLNGASVDFNSPLTSTTHIRALHPKSNIYFSSTSISTLSRSYGVRVSSSGVGASNPTHLFALFSLGSVVVRDGAVLLLTASAAPGEVGGTMENARFFANAVYNSGVLTIDKQAVLEVVNFQQNTELLSLSNLISPSKVELKGNDVYSYSTPVTHVAHTQASLRAVPLRKYVYDSSTGVVAERKLTQADILTVNPVTTAFGYFGGVSGAFIQAPVTVAHPGVFSPGSNYPSARLLGSGAPVTPGQTTYALSPGKLRVEGAMRCQGIIAIELVNKNKDITFDELHIDGVLDLTEATLNLTSNLDATLVNAKTMGYEVPMNTMGMLDSMDVQWDDSRVDSQDMAKESRSGRVFATQSQSETVFEGESAMKTHKVEVDGSQYEKSAVKVFDAYYDTTSVASSSQVFRIPIIKAKNIVGRFKAIHARHVTDNGAVKVMSRKTKHSVFSSSTTGTSGTGTSESTSTSRGLVLGATSIESKGQASYNGRVLSMSIEYSADGTAVYLVGYNSKGGLRNSVGDMGVMKTNMSVAIAAAAVALAVWYMQARKEEY